MLIIILTLNVGMFYSYNLKWVQMRGFNWVVSKFSSSIVILIP